MSQSLTGHHNLTFAKCKILPSPLPSTLYPDVNLALTLILALAFSTLTPGSLVAPSLDRVDSSQPRTIPDGKGGYIREAPYDAVADVETCKRLHRLLVEATGWEKLHVAEVEDLAEFRAYNQPLGDLWAWFVNNCAFNEPTWEAYRDLRRLR